MTRLNFISRGWHAFMVVSIFALFSCGSSPESQPKAVEENIVIDDSEAVYVPVASPKKKSFFASIKKQDMEAIEIGSPQSLRQAYNNLHKSVEEGYSDSERTILNIISVMMDVAWPSEKGNMVSPRIINTDQYSGIVDSVRNGIYDLSADSSDFLLSLLPSLVILSSSNMSEYYGKAEESLSKALEFRPDSVIANYVMGVLYLRTGRAEEALKHLNTANGKYSAGTKEILLAIADACFETDNLELALTVGEQLLARNPQDTMILDLCARSAYALGDLDKTESYIVRILLLEPDNADYVLFRARILMQKQDFIRASSLLDVCARKNQTTREYYILRARLQCDWNKNYTSAAETASKALELYPDDLDIMLLAAEMASLTGKSVNGMSAMEIARKALEKDPSNSKANEICISEMYRNGEYQQAYALSSRMVKEQNVQKSVLYTHIDVCLALRRTTEAGNIAGRLYKENPGDEEAQMAYIKVLAASGQGGTANQLIAKLLPDANAKMKSFLYYERSFLQGTEDQILSDLRSSLTANPRNKDSLYRLYQIYYNKKDWRRAQYYLKQVVALDPANSIYVRQNSELDKLLKR
ncbi:tetratricopeptide repeat protein [Treponema sp.]|uniref:tetratricopeptide repeat protein n=1 Tax=Treponema sp. TaxID=166 RepID=UPI00388FE4AA